MFKPILIFFFLFCSISISAQRKCATVDANNEAIKNYPELLQRKNYMRKALISKDQYSKTTEDGAIVIPVVVHILYRNSQENIIEERVHEQIDILNENFRRLNSNYATGTPDVFKSLSADIKIEFELAKYTPEGAETDGIIRKNVNFLIEANATDGKYYSSARGGSDAWDPNQYMNIWVGNLGDEGILGYAYLPSSAGMPYDGLAIDYRFFGDVSSDNYFGQHHGYESGKTAVHEAGHYFGLYHIWGKGGGDSCNDDDEVSDTPNQRNPTNESNSFTPTFIEDDTSLICSDTGENGIMFMNYMDYVFDDTMTMFTQGQNTVIQDALFNYRPGLVTSIGLNCIKTTHYIDKDGDGLGDPNGATIESCERPKGYSRNNFDEDDEKANNIAIIENPIRDGIIKINSAEDIEIIYLYNAQGSLVDTYFPKYPNKSQPEMKLNAALSSGIYFLVGKTVNGEFNQKIFVE